MHGSAPAVMHGSAPAVMHTQLSPCSLHGSAPAVMHGSAPAACMEAPHSSPGGSGGQRTSPIDSLRPGAGVSGSVTFDRSRSSHAGVAIVRTDDACRTCVAYVWGCARGTPQATRFFMSMCFLCRVPIIFLVALRVWSLCVVAFLASVLFFATPADGLLVGEVAGVTAQSFKQFNAVPRLRSTAVGSVLACCGFSLDCGGHIRGMCFLRRGF